MAKLKVNVYDMQGNEVDKITLSESVFGITPNKTVLHTAVVSYLANQRQGNQSTKTRSEVRGGGRKPYRQKGTGHARQGSTRSPHYRHGGIALGPKPRDYRVKLNRKVRRLAMLSALSTKVLEGNLIVVDSIEMDEYRTKTVVEMLSALGVEGKAMLVMPERDDFVVRSASNIPGLKTALTNTMNVYDILNSGKFILTLDAVKLIEEVYA